MGFIFGICLCLILTTLVGENPIQVLQVLVKSSFGSIDDLALTLFYSTSLMFTGLSVCIAYQAGLFNIGAEGQLVIGTLVTTGAGLYFSQFFDAVNSSLFVAFLISVFCLILGIVAAAAWGFLPGYLKAKRGSHEVITTMMLNFIAAGIATEFVIKNQNPNSQNPESAVINQIFSWKNLDPLHNLAPDTNLNISFIIALVSCFLLGFLLKKTTWGFKLRLTGANPNTARWSGIRVSKYQIQSLAIAGAFAGLVAANEIFGSQMKYRLGFSPDYGFIGIAVALLARSRAEFIPISAFLFAVLQKGATDLDIETDFITRDFSRVMQAIIILSVVSFSVFNFKSIFSIRRKNKGS